MRLRDATILAGTAFGLAGPALGLAGCGSSSPSRADRAVSEKPAVVESRPPAAARPLMVTLRLQLPLIGLSSARTVSYATSAAKPVLRGVVSPAGATVYLQGPDGTRSAVNPRPDGSFAVPARLVPGGNSFRFTAARLGSPSASANLAVTWRGPAAAARERAIQADPAKYLAPASAGLNRKLASLGNVPAVTAPTRRVTVTFTLNTIKAPPPPAIGGDGRWLGGFELTEYYPALESWFVGRAVARPRPAGTHRIDWLYSARGLSMEGDGIGLDGRPYHIANLGSGGWLTAGGGNGARFGVGADAPVLAHRRLLAQQQRGAHLPAGRRRLVERHRACATSAPRRASRSRPGPRARSPTCAAWPSTPA